MIISASRRTDVPAWYGGWLLQRLRQGEALVSNPFRPRRITRLRFSPQTVEALVLWTKHPEPMLSLLPEIDRLGYRYYFTYTLTPYGPEWEPGFPAVERRIACFQALSRRLGPSRVDWRYDPVILTADRGTGWHLEQFERLCRQLAPYTTRCIFSFFDSYRHLGKRFAPPDEEQMFEIAAGFAAIAREHRLPLYTCAEPSDLSRWGIAHAACIDPQKIAELCGGRKISYKKDAGQRPACGCAPSVDIGSYDTCPGGCVYCYGTRSRIRAQQRFAAHDPGCPLLEGPPPDGAEITVRQAEAAFLKAAVENFTGEQEQIGGGK
ncbi:MAG: DUF1848 domain-containing protein [Provencibacterium sp.]|jgi:hypothetical protein|nr:DUF1848 domain-containing protein [Provencibacterium sp.]